MEDELRVARKMLKREFGKKVGGQKATEVKHSLSGVERGLSALRGLYNSAEQFIDYIAAYIQCYQNGECAAFNSIPRSELVEFVATRGIKATGTKKEIVEKMMDIDFLADGTTMSALIRRVKANEYEDVRAKLAHYARTVNKCHFMKDGKACKEYRAITIPTLKWYIRKYYPLVPTQGKTKDELLLDLFEYIEHHPGVTWKKYLLKKMGHVSDEDKFWDGVKRMAQLYGECTVNEIQNSCNELSRMNMQDIRRMTRSHAPRVNINASDTEVAMALFSMIPRSKGVSWSKYISDLQKEKRELINFAKIIGDAVVKCNGGDANACRELQSYNVTQIKPLIKAIYPNMKVSGSRDEITLRLLKRVNYPNIKAVSNYYAKQGYLDYGE